MMKGTRILLMVIAALSYLLLLPGHDERDKNNADGGKNYALLFIVARG